MFDFSEKTKPLKKFSGPLIECGKGFLLNNNFSDPA